MSSSIPDSNSFSDRPLWIALGANAAAAVIGVIVVPLFLRHWFSDTTAAIRVGILAPSVAVWSIVGLIGVGHVLWDAIWIIGFDNSVAPAEETLPEEKEEELSPPSSQARSGRPLPVPRPRVDENLFGVGSRPPEKQSREPSLSAANGL